MKIISRCESMIVCSLIALLHLSKHFVIERKLNVFYGCDMQLSFPYANTSSASGIFSTAPRVKLMYAVQKKETKCLNGSRMWRGRTN